MNDMSKATITMVKNAIESKPNAEQHKTGGFYLRKDNEQIYALFASNRVDLWHNGNHIKAIEAPKVKDMKEAMNNAKEIIKGIDKQLDLVVNSKELNTNLEKLKNTIDTHKDKLKPKDLIAVESFKMAIKESFKNNPEQASQAVKVLASKIPDVAIGKIQLPDAPTIKQQADINISQTKQSGQDRSR